MGQLKGLAVAGIMMMIALQSVAQKELKKANKRLNNSQTSMTKSLGKYPMDASGKTALNSFLSQTDSLQKIIMNDKNLSVAQKVMAINCQCYFYDTLQSQIKGKTFSVDILNESRENFIPLWQTISAEKPYDNIFASFDANTAGVMATAFKDYPQAARIRDIAILKNTERSPENIMKFLANNSNFSLRDSLIFIYGNAFPERLVSYVNDAKNPELVKAVREHNNPLIQTLLSISTEKN
ncbi:MAG TPA: hypothetical protein VK484_00490, partial [Ferruginibacter sp.]|nr:hypothetical protein [Ferruginibacter sp.]